VLLIPGSTCWRVERAGRAALFIDMADYFKAARGAMAKATRSVHLLNWAFEPDTLFDPPPNPSADDTDRFGRFLRRLAKERPEVDVRLLCWKSALPVAATMNFFPLRDRRFFADSAVKFVLDGELPLGAAHHQKMIIVDDAVAFCGGGDIAPDRWDTPRHLDDDPRRARTPSDTRQFDSRHEVMAIVDGEPAAALGELFRERWRRATGEVLAQSPPPPPVAWPDGVSPVFRKVDVGVSRTSAPWRGFQAIREGEALTFASIALARRCIYLENQYFTSPIVAEALAARLEEPDGPEVILVSTEHSPSYFDQMTMDRTRAGFIRRLKTADRHGRFHAYCPVTTLGRVIIVHAKLAIIDDWMLRVGSANMNNRSMGFDTECDLTLDASKANEGASRVEIGNIRTTLLAHWLGCPAQAMDEAIESHGGVGPAIEALRESGHCRLRPLEPVALGPLASFISTFHIGDPVGPADSWRPWRRRRQLALELERMVAKLRKTPGVTEREANALAAEGAPTAA
jgi:phosphatidylserine/phosphatidylglycerophosphate/cardiolipin synthase-like enzyme